MYHLYVKTHNRTGLKYLGRTMKDPNTYSGSGVYWLRHLKEHGNEVSTEILGSFKTLDEFRFYGFFYSKLWDIVNSEQWANLTEELGEGVDRRPKSEIHRKNMSVAQRARQAQRIIKIKEKKPHGLLGKTKSEEHCKKISLANTGKKHTVESRLKMRGKRQKTLSKENLLINNPLA